MCLAVERDVANGIHIANRMVENCTQREQMFPTGFIQARIDCRFPINDIFVLRMEIQINQTNSRRSETSMATLTMIGNVFRNELPIIFEPDGARLLNQVALAVFSLQHLDLKNFGSAREVAKPACRGVTLRLHQISRVMIQAQVFPDLVCLARPLDGVGEWTVALGDVPTRRILRVHGVRAVLHTLSHELFLEVSAHASGEFIALDWLAPRVQ